MLRFLGSFFSGDEDRDDGLDASVVDAAIERVIDVTDPRLRAFPNYRRNLEQGVRRSLLHARRLVDDLPDPVEISRRSFGLDPRLRAFFSSPARMQEAISRAPTLVAFLENYRGPYPDNIYGLLAPEMSERKVLGVEMQGELLRRDVMQEVVDFSDHRYLGAAGSEAEARRELHKRAFDYLAELALKRIIQLKEKRSELERQKRLLQRKLDAMKAGGFGLDAVLSGDGVQHPDFLSLEQQIESVETELMGMPCSKANLEARFDCINGVMENPERGLSQRTVTLHVDDMSVKVEDPQDTEIPPMQFTEFFSDSGDRRVVLFGYFPRSELPPKKDFFAEAGRYLG